MNKDTQLLQEAYQKVSEGRGQILDQLDSPYLQKYDWARIENDRRTGHDILCGGILPVEELKVGQLWVGTSGTQVTITGIDGDWITYEWSENGQTKTHEKESFAFQCRYCLVVSDSDSQVTDRKTGEKYDPKQKFDDLMNSPETKAQFTRMKNEVGIGWPKREKVRL